MERTSGKEIRKGWGLPYNIILGGLIGAAISVLLSVIFAVILATTSIADSSISVFALICAVAGAFVGGFISANRIKKNGLVSGLLACVVFLFIMFSVKTMLTGFSNISMSALIYIAISLIASSVGGIFAVNRKRK
ncbi:MAG: TIGR04086 family membrane protein [Ruminococcaceae bacterium]|nr:TIGR04086 family membrane protein [Oscillospiraceae bacterium]